MDPRLAERFGRNLRLRRRGTGLSQEGLARLTELHRVEVGELERGRRLPRLDTILKLSAAVGASPCVLLAGLRWQPGHCVEGEFQVEDGSQPAAGART